MYQICGKLAYQGDTIQNSRIIDMFNILNESNLNNQNYSSIAAFEFSMSTSYQNNSFICVLEAMLNN